MFPGTHKAGTLLHMQKNDGVVATHTAYEAVTFPLQRQGKEDFLRWAQEGWREELHVLGGLGALALRAKAPSCLPLNSWSRADTRPTWLSSQGAALGLMTHPVTVWREEQVGNGPRIQRETVQCLPSEDVPQDDAGIPAPREQPAGCRPPRQHQQGRHAAAAAQHTGHSFIYERESGRQQPVLPSPSSAFLQPRSPG